MEYAQACRQLGPDESYGWADIEQLCSELCSLFSFGDAFEFSWSVNKVILHGLPSSIFCSARL